MTRPEPFSEYSAKVLVALVVYGVPAVVIGYFVVQWFRGHGFRWPP